MMIVEIAPQHTFFIPLGSPGEPGFEMLLLLPALPPEVDQQDPSYQAFLADFQGVCCLRSAQSEVREIRVEHAQVHYVFQALEPFAEAMLREQRICIGLYSPQLGFPGGDLPAAQVRVNPA